jgi:hypothetical protein
VDRGGDGVAGAVRPHCGGELADAGEEQDEREERLRRAGVAERAREPEAEDDQSACERERAEDSGIGDRLQVDSRRRRSRRPAPAKRGRGHGLLLSKSDYDLYARRVEL